ncbi:MAG TPA: molybdenum cofactor guanylyltransferase [Chloroflexi bacterium]|nr:molybdenum cofactor guanylyltransferase [Chloroflexota bacterium]
MFPFGGRPLIVHIVARLALLAEQVLVTTNRPETLAFLDVPCYPDPWPGYGALGELYTALYYAATPWVPVAACDIPFASPLLFRRAWTLLQQKPQAVAAVPRTTRGWEPFHAVYRRSACLAHWGRRCRQGNAGYRPGWSAAAHGSGAAFERFAAHTCTSAMGPLREVRVSSQGAGETASSGTRVWRRAVMCP